MFITRKNGSEALPFFYSVESSEAPPTPPSTPIVTPTTPPTPDVDDDDPANWDKERAKSTILKQREAEKQAKVVKKERDELAAKVQESERAKLSEDERKAADLKRLTDQNELQTQRQTNLIAAARRRVAESALETAALANGMDAKGTRKLADLTQIAFKDESDDDPIGTIDAKSVERAIKAVLTEHPYVQTAKKTASIPGTDAAGEPVIVKSDDTKAKAGIGRFFSNNF